MPVADRTLSRVVLSVSTVVLLAAVVTWGVVLDRAPALLALRGAPAVAADAASAPLVLPPEVTDPGGYTFVRTGDGGAPVVWDPCAPVHVVVRPTAEPPGGRDAVRAALDEVGAASGLVFVVDGETDEAPSTQRRGTDHARYGDRAAPVLVAWSDAAEYPPLGGALGVAGPLPATGATGERWVSGSVVLDAAWFADALDDDLGRRRAGAVLRHELAHLVGLGHSADPFSLMSPAYQSVFELSLSDRAGLARLGGGACAAS